MLLKGPAQQLADFMVKLSQKYHLKEWEFGWEFELWNEINGNQDLISDEEVTKLKELSDWCKGWIKMAYEGDNESLTFLLLNDWLDKFEKESPF